LKVEKLTRRQWCIATSKRHNGQQASVKKKHEKIQWCCEKEECIIKIDSLKYEN
jgi:hypothetical protein